MAYANVFGIDLRTVGDIAAMAATVDFHICLLPVLQSSKLFASCDQIENSPGDALRLRSGQAPGSEKETLK
jgi:hypothetical protein